MILDQQTANYLTISIISFIFGNITGYVIRGIISKMDRQIDARLVVLLSVTVAFSISVIVDMINPEYTTSPFLYGLMGSIVGFFYKMPEPRK